MHSTPATSSRSLRRLSKALLDEHGSDLLNHMLLEQQGRDMDDERFELARRAEDSPEAMASYEAELFRQAAAIRTRMGSLLGADWRGPSALRGGAVEEKALECASSARQRIGKLLG